MKWEKVGKSYYEGKNKKYEFSIRKEDNEWYLYIFLNNVKDNDEAYQETVTYKTLKEAKKDAELYI